MTKRCNQRKAFLGPWHPEVSAIWAYSIARGQEKYEVEVHHGALAMNHEHLSATPTKANNFCRFITDVHTDVSKGVNTLLATCRYDAPHELLDSRKPHYMRLMDPEAQAARLSYDNLNCVAAGLVARPEQMPGRLFTFDAWLTGHIDIRKPSVYFGKREPEVRRLYVTPPALLYEAFGGDMDKLVYHMKRLEEGGVQALRNARTRAPMGARAVTRVHPWSEPKTLRSDSGEPNQTFAWGARSAAARKLRIESAKEVRGFRREHGDRSQAFRSGDHDVVFPFGTYGMVVMNGARMEPECQLGALVTRPGPTFEEVRARLQHVEGHDAASDEAMETIQATRVAIDEGAAKFCEEECVDFASKSTNSASSSPERNAQSPTVRHRFDRQIPVGQATRVVTLRDKRRGRPRKRKPPRGRHGSDPPA